MTRLIPKDRSSIQVAAICVLEQEFSAMATALDMDFDECPGERLGKLPNDTNSYTPGQIGNHDVVIVLLPYTRIEPAIAATASTLLSYPQIKVPFVVGVCGSALKDQEGDDIILGDVIISTYVFHLSYARIVSGGTIEPYKDVAATLGRAPKAISSYLLKCQSTYKIQKIQEKFYKYVNALL